MTPHQLRFAAALLLVPLALSAQTAPVTPAKPAAPATTAASTAKAATDAEAATTGETVKLAAVEVTGSRLRLNAEEAPAIPVFSLPQIELERRGVTRLADLRLAIPQLGGAVGFNDNLTNSGTSRAQTVSTSFNLRGLGGNSTLVLVDGRRVPRSGQEAPGGAGGREDFNVDGIPVSAIERIDILPQSAGAIYGSEGIAGVINIVLKKNYTGAELNVTYDNSFKTDVGQTTVALTAGYRAGKLSTFLSASFEHQNGLASRDRWFSAKSAFPEYGGSTSFLQQQVPLGTGSLSKSSFPFFGGASLPGLTTNQVAIPAGSNGTTAANSAYSTATTLTPYDPAAHSILIDPAQRRSVVFKGDYDYVPWLQPYLAVRWSRFDDDSYGTPPIINFQASLPASYAGNPFASTVNLNKVFYDLPLLETFSSQENFSTALGLRGTLFADWRYDVSGTFARNTVKDDPRSAGFVFGLVSAAINNSDPTKRPILAYDSTRVSDPNPAGLLDSLRPKYPHKDTSDVYDYLVQVDGTVWSGWAGDVKLAVGGEAQEEKVKFSRIPGDSSRSFTLTAPFSRRTTAAFAETTVPLLSAKQNISFVHRLSVGGAVRAEDYSDIGSQTAPSYNAQFQPYKGLTFRASRAEGFKGARLYDLLGPITTGVSTLTIASNVHDSLRGGEPVLGTVNTISGGNPTLAPETSRSKNWGVVVDVPGKWFKGLSFSADHYDLTYTNRSGAPARQILIDFFPERVMRGTKSPSDPANYAAPITGFDTRNINLTGVRTRGWDYELSYLRTTGIGEFSVSFAYSEPGKVITKATPAANPTASGQPRKLSGSLFWGRGPWEVGVAANYQDKYYINGTFTSIPEPSYIEWNPRASYRFAAVEKGATWWNRAVGGSKVSLTLINVLDKEPNPADAANGRIIMDPRLRRYVLSFTKKL